MYLHTIKVFISYGLYYYDCYYEIVVFFLLPYIVSYSHSMCLLLYVSQWYFDCI